MASSRNPSPGTKRSAGKERLNKQADESKETKTKAKATSKAEKPVEHEPTPHEEGTEPKPHEPTLSAEEQAKADAEAKAKEEAANAPDAPGEPARITGEVRLEGGSLDYNGLADLLASLNAADTPGLQGANRTKVIEHFAHKLAEQDESFDHDAFVQRASA